MSECLRTIHRSRRLHLPDRNQKRIWRRCVFSSIWRAIWRSGKRDWRRDGFREIQKKSL